MELYLHYYWSNSWLLLCAQSEALTLVQAASTKLNYGEHLRCNYMVTRHHCRSLSYISQGSADIVLLQFNTVSHIPIDFFCKKYTLEILICGGGWILVP